MTESSVAGTDDRRNETDNSTKLMVALDVDGTLVDHDGHMSAPVREAAQAVVAAGHDVMIATGRSLNATLPIIEHIGIDNGYAVCCNGGVTLRAGLRPARRLRNHPQGNVRPRPGAPRPAQAAALGQVRAGGRGRQLPLHRTLPGRQLRRRGDRRRLPDHAGGHRRARGGLQLGEHARRNSTPPSGTSASPA